MIAALLIRFDEVDDVFETDGGSFARLFGARAMHNRHKGAIIKLLESNPVPTFWLTNDVQGIDPAFIRRFDWVLEMSVPPRRVRERLIDRHCRGVVDARARDRMADSENLAPAVLTRAAAVVNVLRDGLDAQTASDTLFGLVDGTLRAQGHKPLRLAGTAIGAGAYDLAFVNAGTDLERLVRGITLVNELLTQMEAFEGLLIATTNFLDGLDPAALRRFDLKVRFEALRSDQSWELLRRHCASAGQPEPSDSLMAATNPIGKDARGLRRHSALSASTRAAASGIRSRVRWAALHAAMCDGGHNIRLLLKKLRLLCADVASALLDWLAAFAAAPINKMLPMV